MAEKTDDKVRVELKLPQDEVNVEPAPEVLKNAQKLGQAQEKVKQKMKEVEEKAEKLKQKEDELKKRADESEEPEAADDKKTIAGYEVGAIAKSPLEPPEPKDKKGPSVHQKRVVIFGFILAIASLILWPLISFWFFVAVAGAGALVVAYGTFVKI